MLSLLYMARSDEAFGVRGAALHVWKTVVTNTPKTLGEILPALMAQVIRSLADPAEDPRAAAGRCLGELVRKMGERVLSQIVPILREGMNDPSPQTRQVRVTAGVADWTAGVGGRCRRGAAQCGARGAASPPHREPDDASQQAVGPKHWCTGCPPRLHSPSMRFPLPSIPTGRVQRSAGRAGERGARPAGAAPALAPAGHPGGPLRPRPRSQAGELRWDGCAGNPGPSTLRWVLPGWAPLGCVFIAQALLVQPTTPACPSQGITPV